MICYQGKNWSVNEFNKEFWVWLENLFIHFSPFLHSLLFSSITHNFCLISIPTFIILITNNSYQCRGLIFLKSDEKQNSPIYKTILLCFINKWFFNWMSYHILWVLWSFWWGYKTKPVRKWMKNFFEWMCL